MLYINTYFEEHSKTLFIDTLSKIDSKIYNIAKIQLNNIKYGQNNKVNYNVYEDLIIYRSILEDIIYCSSCFCDINVNTVFQRITKLLNTYC